jgi:hypothetical protein
MDINQATLDAETPLLIPTGFEEKLCGVTAICWGVGVEAKSFHIFFRFNLDAAPPNRLKMTIS